MLKFLIKLIEDKVIIGVDKILLGDLNLFIFLTIKFWVLSKYNKIE